jgi:hypothetical protein
VGSRRAASRDRRARRARRSRSPRVRPRGCRRRCAAGRPRLQLGVDGLELVELGLARSIVSSWRSTSGRQHEQRGGDGAGDQRDHAEQDGGAAPAGDPPVDGDRAREVTERERPASDARRRCAGSRTARHRGDRHGSRRRSAPRGSPPQTVSAAPARCERVAAAERGRLAEVGLDAQQLVVLGDPVAAGRRTRS